MLEIEGARIQLLDLPGIIEGAASGRGRGRQVVAVAKTADLILIVLDVAKAEEQKRLLEIELEAIGIRINRKRPDVLLKPKKAGGVSISHTVPLTKIDEKTIRTIVCFVMYIQWRVWLIGDGSISAVGEQVAQHGRLRPRGHNGRRIH